MADIALYPGSNLGQVIGAARAGDRFLLEPGVYPQPQIRVRVPHVTIMSDGGATLDGTGLDYTGDSDAPRAALEILPLAYGCKIEKVTVINCRNKPGNAAGVRIMDTNGVTLESCSIAGCDNGLFSSGHNSIMRILSCEISGNGSNTQAHNVYLSGGTSAMFHKCHMDGTIKGQNVKSRVGFLTLVECEIEDSASRELDLVDSMMTADPSHRVTLVGCHIRKRDGRNETDPEKRVANRGVVHFGKDGKDDYDNLGTLTMVDCRIETVHADPVFTLTGTYNRVVLVNTDIVNPGPEKPGELDDVQRVLDVRLGAPDGRFTKHGGVLGPRFRMLI